MKKPPHLSRCGGLSNALARAVKAVSDLGQERVVVRVIHGVRKQLQLLALLRLPLLFLRPHRREILYQLACCGVAVVVASARAMSLRCTGSPRLALDATIRPDFIDRFVAVYLDYFTLWVFVDWFIH